MIVTVHQSKKIIPCKVVAPSMQTTREEAWNWIKQRWCTTIWIACPEWVKTELKLHPALGVCGGMLITKQSALGLDEFIHKVNRIGA